MGSPVGRSNRRWRLTLAGAALLAALAAAPAGVNAAAEQPPAGAEDASASASPSPEPSLVGRLFTLDRGKFTTFGIPFGQFGGDAVAINDSGQIVGSYYSGPDRTCLRGFLRDAKGRFSRIDFPEDGTTQLLDVNAGGQMVGTHRPSVTGGCSDAVPLQGFVRDKRGRFTTIRIPGAQQVQALGINNRGQVVGQYDAADGSLHGYLLDRGRLTTVDGPPGATGAAVLDISDDGEMVGLYLDAAGAQHAFELSQGRYTTIDAPGAPFTVPFGVNDRGQIAGFTVRTLPLGFTSDAHGFVLREGVGGTLTAVDVPGAVGGTIVTDINNAGVAAGVYGTPAPAPPR